MKLQKILNNLKKFDKKDRSKFNYYFYHVLAFNLVAKELHCWKFKYLFHDFEKPWLKLFFKYATVQKWHRTHNAHHLEYKGQKDYEAMVIDWECSHYTKYAAPRTALQEAAYKLHDGSMNYNDYYAFVATAVKMGLKN